MKIIMKTITTAKVTTTSTMLQAIKPSSISQKIFFNRSRTNRTAIGYFLYFKQQTDF